MTDYNTRDKYLDALAQWGTIGKACKKSGTDRKKVHEFRKDDEFLVEEELAMEEFKGSLIDAAVTRGRDGWEEQLKYRGQNCWQRDPQSEHIMLTPKGAPIPVTERRYSDTLLIKAIERFFPDGKVFLTATRPKTIEIEFVDGCDDEEVAE